MKFFGKPTKIKLTRGAQDNRPKAQVTLKVNDDLMVFNLGEIECKKLADEFLTGKMTVECDSKPKNDEVEPGVLIESRPLENFIENKKRRKNETPKESIKRTEPEKIDGLTESSLEDDTKNFLSAGQEMFKKMHEQWADIEARAKIFENKRLLAKSVVPAPALKTPPPPPPPPPPSTLQSQLSMKKSAFNSQTASDEETAAAVKSIQAVMISDSEESETEVELPDTNVSLTTVSSDTRYILGPETRTCVKILINLLEKLNFKKLSPEDIEIFLSCFEPLLGFFDQGVSTKWCKRAAFNIFFEMDSCNGVGAYQSCLSLITKEIIQEICETKSTQGFEILEKYLENLKATLDKHLNSLE